MDAPDRGKTVGAAAPCRRDAFKFITFPFRLQRACARGLADRTGGVLECAAMNRFALSAACLLSLSARFAGGADARAAEDRLQFADALFARGLNARAAAEYESFLADAPAGAPGLDAAWFRLGEARRMLGKGEEALVAYEKAADFPGSPFREKALFKRAAVFTQLDMDEAAEELYAGLLADKPSGDVLEMALYYHGDSLRSLGRGDEALAEFERQLREFPKGPMAAYARLQLGKLLSLPGPKRDVKRATAILRALADDQGYCPFRAGQGIRWGSIPM